MTLPTVPPPVPRNKSLASASVRSGTVARGALKAVRAIRFSLRRLGLVLLALIIVFEEWGWQPLAAGLARLARYKPVAAVEAWIERLPPYGALAVFAVPSLLIVPLKLVALWLITAGHTFSAAALFIGAKIVGTALVARIFQLTQKRLMSLRWFAWLHDATMPRLHAMSDAVHNSAVWQRGRQIKRRLRRQVALQVLRWKPTVEPVIAAARARLAGLIQRR